MDERTTTSTDSRTRRARRAPIEWTGPPLALLPGIDAAGRLHSLPMLRTTASRREVLEYFDNTWALTELLFSGLASEAAFYRLPYHALRHPLVFYYGHPAALYVNKLRVAGLLRAPVDARLERIFETGVDEMRWDDLHETAPDIWPPLAEITAYRRCVHAVVRDLIERHPKLDAPIGPDDALWALVMAFEHERIHFETSSVLVRELPIELVRRPAAWPASSTERRPSRCNQMVAVPETIVTLGKPAEVPTFGWDNEYGRELHMCPAFEASARLVSNAEVLEFVAAGGYADEALWSKEGWAWRRFRNTKAPTFWVPRGPQGLHEYGLRTVFEIVELQPSWPACLNFHEAMAYCAWRGRADGCTYRPLSELQHHAIRGGCPDDPIVAGTWAERGFNLNLSTGSERPVDASPPNERGFHDVHGNVWQWSADTFHPLAGARPHPLYEDFSTPCYDGEHHMIFGGSFASTGDLASRYARYHFRPHFFQHAGLRLARGAEVRRTGPALYESQELVDRYMLMHWASEDEMWSGVPDVPRPAVAHLPQRCAALVVEHARTFGRALDLGCAVGRATFELARRFDEVVGIDFSGEFVQRASQLQREGASGYWRKASGSDGDPLVARVEPAVDRSRVRFAEGDACALPTDVAGFDAVLLSNVLCRLPDPQACLGRMQGERALVRPGGVLVMTTPLSWLESYTPKERWLRGVPAIAAVLDDFTLVHEEEVPFLIREHARKLEYIVTKATVWRRRG